jgi:hypothetical protein
MSNEVKTWKRSKKADASNPYEYAAVRLKGNTQEYYVTTYMDV